MSKWTKEQLEEMFGNDKLAQLAFLSGCHKHRFSNDKTIPDGWVIPDEVLAKFAELIVRECMDISMEQKKWVEDMKAHNPTDEFWNQARIQQSQRIIDKIREHFGVEE